GPGRGHAPGPPAGGGQPRTTARGRGAGRGAAAARTRRRHGAGACRASGREPVRGARRRHARAQRAGRGKNGRAAGAGDDGRSRGHRHGDAGARGSLPAPGPARGERGMNVSRLAMQEIRAGLRNRWVVATTLLLAALSLSLVLLGSAPTGTVKADPLAVIVVSLASLTIFLVPLIALLLSFDAIVGEHERGTLMLLLAYPVARWQVVVGKVLGHTAILAIATLIGYGAAAAALWIQGDVADAAWGPFAAMVATSILLGAAFVVIGCLASTLVRER